MKKFFVLLIAFLAICAYAGAAVTNLGTLKLHSFDGNSGNDEMLRITNNVPNYDNILSVLNGFFWDKSPNDETIWNTIKLEYDGVNVKATITNVAKGSKWTAWLPFPGVTGGKIDMALTLYSHGSTDNFKVIAKDFTVTGTTFSVGPQPSYTVPVPLQTVTDNLQTNGMFAALEFKVCLPGAELTDIDFLTIDFSQEEAGPLGEGPIVWFDPCRETLDQNPDHPVEGAVMCWDNWGTLRDLDPPLGLLAACAPNYCTRPIADGCFLINCPDPNSEGGVSQVHGGLWFKESACYGMSSILTFPYNDAILSDWTSVLTPQVGATPQETKNMFLMFKPTELDDDDIQTIFEVGGAISGFNVYIDKGYLCMGAWNRVQRYAFVFSTMPLVAGDMYLAHMEMRHEAAIYENKILVQEAQYKVRMILNGESSPWYCFKGFQHDDSEGALGGESHGTTYNINQGVFDDYARWFNGCIGDVRIYAGPFNVADENGEYAFYNGKYGTSYVYPVSAPPAKNSDWKFYDNSPMEGNSSTFEVYPNPFSNSATLDLRLADAQRVRVELFDMAGVKVMTVFDGNCSKGLNSFPINGSNLFSGVYAVRISGNNFTNMTKVVLTK